VGHDPIAVAVSTSGSTLYVLNTVGAGANVGVIDVATEAQTKVLPAPADSVAVQVSPDGGSLYVVVGTPTVGNVQVYAIAP
jgi:Tol biopolymer transport system component